MMHKLVFCCFIISFSRPLSSLPVINDSEMPYQLSAKNLTTWMSKVFKFLILVQVFLNIGGLFSAVYFLTYSPYSYRSYTVLPILAADEDLRLNLEQLGSLGSTSLLQLLPELVGTLTEDNKAGLSPSSYSPRENIKEAFYGNHPRIAFLGRFLTKGRKQYKKRGNLSECFWKYCV